MASEKLSVSEVCINHRRARIKASGVRTNKQNVSGLKSASR